MNQPAEKKKTLVEIALELREVLWDVDGAEGILDEELEAALDGAEAALEAKVDNCLLLAQEFDGMAAVHQERADIQAERAGTLANQAKRLREYIRRSLELAGVMKCPTENFPKVRLQKGRASTKVNPLEFIPWANREGEIDLLRVRDPEPDKKAIKERLDAGEKIPGCSVEIGSMSLRWK